MTLVPKQYTQPYGVDEMHAVFFQPRDDRGGVRDTVMVMIPESEANIETALAQARYLCARVLLVCDTADQAGEVRERTKGLLPDHREVALNRAEAGAWGLNA